MKCKCNISTVLFYLLLYSKTIAWWSLELLFEKVNFSEVQWTVDNKLVKYASLQHKIVSSTSHGFQKMGTIVPENCFELCNRSKWIRISVVTKIVTNDDRRDQKAGCRNTTRDKIRVNWWSPCSKFRHPLVIRRPRIVNHCATHCRIWRIFFLCCRRYSPCVVIIAGIELRTATANTTTTTTSGCNIAYFHGLFQLQSCDVKFSLFSHLISSLLVEKCTQNFIRRNWESTLKGKWNEWSSVQNRNR